MISQRYPRMMKIYIGRKLDKANVLLSTLIVNNKSGFDDMKIGFNDIKIGINNLTTIMLEQNKRMDEHNTRLEWDSDKIGNYWSDYKGSGEYVIALGGKNAKDNFPHAMAFSIKSEPILLPAQKGAQPVKSTSGFTAIVAIVSLIVAGIFGSKI
jgi:hypothetical protein